MKNTTIALSASLRDCQISTSVIYFLYGTRFVRSVTGGGSTCNVAAWHWYTTNFVPRKSGKTHYSPDAKLGDELYFWQCALNWLICVSGGFYYIYNMSRRNEPGDADDSDGRVDSAGGVGVDILLSTWQKHRTVATKVGGAIY